MQMISVIVPIYNVEIYLRRCVDSLIGQTYKNLEIILIDDGSPDSCGAICDDYALKDNRIRVIHKSHGGLSSARNAGLDVANGELIGFVDADDYLHPQMYEKLFEAMKRENAEMAICGFKYVDDRGKTIQGQTINTISSRVITGFEAASFLCNRFRTTWVMMVNKLYQSSLFNNLRFPNDKIHEDEYVIHYLFDRCKRIVSISDLLYYYLQRPGSIMHEDKMRIINEYFAMWDRYLFYQKKGREYEAYTTRMLHICGDLLGIGLLGSRENKAILKPLYNKMLSVFIKKHDFLHAWSLFIRQHQWLYRFTQWISRRSKDVWLFLYYLIFLFNCTFAKKPRIFLLTAPVHGNLGDHAIIYAEKDHFSRLGKNKNIVEVPNDVWLRFALRIAKHINIQDTIIISGGGSIGTLWAHEDDKISNIISRFKDNKIVIFPQTCYYDQSPAAKARLKYNRSIYGAAKNLTVMLRDRVSYKFFVTNFPSVKAISTKDIVLSVQSVPKYKHEKREGVLLCFRTDLEKVVSNQLANEIKSLLSENKIPWKETSTVINKRVTAFNRNRELSKKWREFAGSQLVITDRLHGMIFAVITGTPCIALDNISGKVSGAYEFIRDNDDILFVKNQDKLLGSILKMWHKISKC